MWRVAKHLDVVAEVHHSGLTCPQVNRTPAAAHFLQSRTVKNVSLGLHAASVGLFVVQGTRDWETATAHTESQ